MTASALKIPKDQIHRPSDAMIIAYMQENDAMTRQEALGKRYDPREDLPMGAGKPSLERPRNDQRFPPLGVKAVESDQRATQKAPVAHRGGA